jgi:hypothetical protein
VGVGAGVFAAVSEGVDAQKSRVDLPARLEPAN